MNDNNGKKHELPDGAAVNGETVPEEETERKNGFPKDYAELRAGAKFTGAFSEVVEDEEDDETGEADGGKRNSDDDADGADEEEVNIPSLLFDIVETLSVAACVIVLLFVTVFRVAMVSGNSMNKTLFDHDVLIVSDLGFKPRTGDIVVFQKLGTKLGDIDDDEALVKRVIATEGQTIDIDFDTWTVTVDGKVLDESEYRYLAPDAVRRSDFSFPITLGEGEVFVMGDNRNHSTDSRSAAIGIVDERTIFGRVVMRISPITDFCIFGRSKDAG